MPYPQKNKPLLGYVNQAKRKCKFLIESHKLRKDEPELFSPLQPPAPVQSSLCWNSSQPNLYEFLIALHFNGVIKDGKTDVSFAKLIREFFRFLNMPIPTDDELYDERKRILSRKTHKTSFVDSLHDSIIKNLK